MGYTHKDSVGWQLVLSEEKYTPATWILLALFVCSFSTSIISRFALSLSGGGSVNMIFTESAFGFFQLEMIVVLYFILTK
jgi:hypothetical protein